MLFNNYRTDEHGSQYPCCQRLSCSNWLVRTISVRRRTSWVRFPVRGKLNLARESTANGGWLNNNPSSGVNVNVPVKGFAISLWNIKAARTAWRDKCVLFKNLVKGELLICEVQVRPFGAWAMFAVVAFTSFARSAIILTAQRKGININLGVRDALTIFCTATHRRTAHT